MVLIVQPSPLTYAHRKHIVVSATKNGLGTIFAFPVAAREGSLVAYGPDYLHMYRRAPFYVDRILKGTKPADLPVEQPTKIELLVNLPATATATATAATASHTQMMFDALPEDSKQRVREAEAKRAAEAETKRRRDQHARLNRAGLVAAGVFAVLAISYCSKQARALDLDCNPLTGGCVPRASLDPRPYPPPVVVIVPSPWPRGCPSDGPGAFSCDRQHEQ